MKFLPFLIFILLSISAFGQLCNPTNIPVDIYYPNTTTTPTTANGFEYLCGPNTVVYDTIPVGCRFIYVNPGCHLIFKNGQCASVSDVWIKSGGTLTLPSTSVALALFYEPSATIINTVGASPTTYSCASISFPTVNCLTGIKPVDNKNNLFHIWPCPASDELNISLSNLQDKPTDIKLFNSYGQQLFSFSEFPIDNKFPVSNLSSGSYFLIVQTNSGRQTRKLIILH